MSRPEAVAPRRAPLLGDVAALDGLRGLAALMVVASHAAQMQLDLWPGLSLNGIGKQGVYLFFVISAELLTARALAQLRGLLPRGASQQHRAGLVLARVPGRQRGGLRTAGAAPGGWFGG